jgi:Na+/proline symporter
MRQLDLLVIILYLIAIALIGLRLSGRQKSSRDYVVGEGRMAWWTVCTRPRPPRRPLRTHCDPR